MTVALAKINDMYGRALACVDVEFPDLPGGSSGKEGEEGLRETVAEIQQQAVTQAGAGGTAKAGTGQHSVARLNLRNWRNSLGQTANTATRKIPGFKNNFPLPYGEDDDELITKSRAVAVKATEFEVEFTKRGLEKEFVKSGNALVAAFETVLGATNTALSRKGAATGGKASAYQRAAEFFEELDTYIRNKYANQPDKINAWNNATHIERPAGKKKGGNDDEGEKTGNG